jgi:hypothetical protein
VGSFRNIMCGQNLEIMLDERSSAMAKTAKQPRPSILIVVPASLVEKCEKDCANHKTL